jgi:hypothetical protein
VPTNQKTADSGMLLMTKASKPIVARSALKLYPNQPNTQITTQWFVVVGAKFYPTHIARALNLQLQRTLQSQKQRQMKKKD